MSEPLKQRVIGALVLLALAVVFVPWLFNVQPQVVIDETSRIPPAPNIAAKTIVEPFKPQVNSATVPHENVFALLELEAEPLSENGPDTAQQAEPAELKLTPKKELELLGNLSPPRLAEDGLPESWVIQVASYREKQTATELSQDLQGKGYKAFVRPAIAGSIDVHRVYVGPFVLKKHAWEKKSSIDNLLNVQSLITLFEP